jgi:hypothetical protein
MQTATPETFRGLRYGILSRIESHAEAPEWRLRLERFIRLRFRKPRYAVAAAAFLALISLSMTGQIGQTPPEARVNAAVFDNDNASLRPNDYQQWIQVGSSLGPVAGSHEFSHNVYIHPAAYRHFTTTGLFPDGTVIILESAEGRSRSLEVSVKDRRFEGGWQYFTFADAESRPPLSAAAATTDGCRSCHQTRAETEHVFTQSYPALRSAGARS